jgi:hypothetical protein
MKTRIWQTLTVAALLMATSAAQLLAGDDATNNAAKTTGADAEKTSVAVVADLSNAPVRVVQFPKPGLPPLLDQVVRLSQSGTDEAVVRAYIEKAAPAYRITGNDIVQLHDLGISQGVIMSLVEHSQTASITTTEMISPPTQAELQPQPESTNVATAPLTPPEDAREFYDALSPYGSWLDVAGYGWCWQPSVVVVNSGWRPYCDNGEWLWSDCGWYWHSYYSWGWAPFHYGRWFCHANRGWLWCPDRVWGPSWVCWRNSANWCGWAPLPPGAHFIAGHGWRFHGAHVGIDFGFGLGAAHFTFVAHDRFGDRHVGTHALRGGDANNAFHHTTVINNFAVGANNQIINRGVGRETIAAASHTPIREVAVRELPRSGNQVTMPDRVSRVGNSDVVFRPGAQISAVRNNSVMNNGGIRSSREVFARPNPSVRQNLVPRAPSVGTAAPQHLMPNYSMNHVNRAPVLSPNTFQANRSFNGQTRVFATPQSQARSFNRVSPPVQSAPRSFGAAPSYTPHFSGPSVFGRSVQPSGGSGAQFHGSMSRSGSGSSPSVGRHR